MGCQSCWVPIRTKAQSLGTATNSTSSTPHARTLLADLLRGGQHQRPLDDAGSLSPFLSREHAAWVNPAMVLVSLATDQLSAPARNGSAVSPEASGSGLKRIPKLGLVDKAVARTSAKRTNIT
jgi:hypothetical protein